MPARKKRRVPSHIMEELSHETIRRVLPREWVIRRYTPDYGVDIMVEIFEAVDESGNVAETLGEWFFAQVKCTTTTNLRKLSLEPRPNVEKATLSHSQAAQSGDAETLNIDVVSYRIDTDLLHTVQSFGVGVPILLLLVTLDTDTVYFVCLNDLVDKCILHEDKDFISKTTKTLHIPATNVVSQDKDALVPLRFFAKRQKLYAAFAKFTYQHHHVAELIDCHSVRRDIIRVLSTLERNDQNILVDLPPNPLDTIRHFLTIIKLYDFWATTDIWQPIRSAQEVILDLDRLLKLFLETGKTNEDDTTFDTGSDHKVFLLESSISMTWNLLVNLNNIFEEICREWYLPTVLGYLAASPKKSDVTGRTDSELPSLHD